MPITVPKLVIEDASPGFAKGFNSLSLERLPTSAFTMDSLEAATGKWQKEQTTESDFYYLFSERESADITEFQLEVQAAYMGVEVGVSGEFIRKKTVSSSSLSFVYAIEQIVESRVLDGEKLELSHEAQVANKNPSDFIHAFGDCYAYKQYKGGRLCAAVSIEIANEDDLNRVGQALHIKAMEYGSLDESFVKETCETYSEYNISCSLVQQGGSGYQGDLKDVDAFLGYCRDFKGLAFENPQIISMEYTSYSDRPELDHELFIQVDQARPVLFQLAEMSEACDDTSWDARMLDSYCDMARFTTQENQDSKQWKNRNAEIALRADEFLSHHDSPDELLEHRSEILSLTAEATDLSTKVDGLMKDYEARRDLVLFSAPLSLRLGAQAISTRLKTATKWYYPSVGSPAIDIKATRVKAGSGLDGLFLKDKDEVFLASQEQGLSDTYLSGNDSWVTEYCYYAAKGPSNELQHWTLARSKKGSGKYSDYIRKGDVLKLKCVSTSGFLHQKLNYLVAQKGAGGDFTVDV